MIKVDRTAVPIPDSLGKKGKAGDRERSRAIKHFAVNSNEKFNFSAYKEEDVVQALEVLFDEKCAYCESKLLHVMPPDIEHFRPKGEVAEDKSHPGYWWLASAWDNLLLSCRDCNSSRYHVIFEDNNGSLQNNRILAGKHCSFPLKGAFRAASMADDHLKEDSLLIDPTLKDPEVHIKWSLRYSSALAVPSSHATIVDEYGYESIKVYALNRQKLVKARLSHANEIKNEIIAIKLMVAELALKPKVESVGALGVLRVMLDNLNRRRESSKVFSAFSKYVIDEGLKDIHAELADLLSGP
ncbi:hypothetical protein ACIP01_23840 [Pseudomonas monteilii]|uniref:hypothetical protein n=1 Tax=Pseudomonas monteilii TaxID=76759 RepID=UPI0038174AD8